jgi:transcriptional regulator with XRE-family HTH domain
MPPLAKVGELGNFIRDQRQNARLSLRGLSSMAGISNPYLSQIERGLRRPSAEILQAIARALRISSETLYVKAGILDDHPADADVLAVILRDASLNEKQRRVMTEIYQSFRHENELETQTPVTATRAVAASKPRKPRAAKPKATPSEPTASE